MGGTLRKITFRVLGLGFGLRVYGLGAKVASVAPFTAGHFGDQLHPYEFVAPVGRASTRSSHFNSNWLGRCHRLIKSHLLV